LLVGIVVPPPAVGFAESGNLRGRRSCATLEAPNQRYGAKPMATKRRKPPSALSRSGPAKRPPAAPPARDVAAPSVAPSSRHRPAAQHRVYRDVWASLSAKNAGEGALMGVEIQAGAVTFMLGQDDFAKGRTPEGVGTRIYCYTAQDIDGSRADQGARRRARSGAEGYAVGRSGVHDLRPDGFSSRSWRGSCAPRGPRTRRVDLLLRLFESRVATSPLRGFPAASPP